MGSRLLLLRVACGMLVALRSPASAWGPLLEPAKASIGRHYRPFVGGRNSKDKPSPLHPSGRFSHHRSRREPGSSAHVYDSDPSEQEPWLQAYSGEYISDNRAFLLWEPHSALEEQELLFYGNEDGEILLGEECVGEECDSECAIPNEYKIDDRLAAEVVAFLGIRRAKPIQTPLSLVGEWE